MKCEEMMNLMQQSLDQDLTAEEERVMMAHLKQCPGCSDLYVRLKLLNEELAQLPKVKPAYSIVDAILPQLEDMPLWSEEPSAGPESSAAAREQPALAVLPGRKSKPGLISWKIFSGVAAAGIVIGLLLSNQDNLQLNKSASESAAMADRMAAPQAAAGSKESTQIMNQKTESMKEFTPSDATAVPMAGGSGQGAAAMPVPSETPAASSAINEEQKDASGRVTMASPLDSVVKDQFGKMTAASPEASAPKEAPVESSASQDQDAGQASDGSRSPSAVPVESPLPDLTSESLSEGSAMSFTLRGQTDEPEAAASDSAKSDKGLPDTAADANAKRMGLQPMEALPADGVPEPLASPDGSFTASVVEGKVTISGKDGASVFVSSTKPGPEEHVKFGGWTDGHTFTYSVRSSSGAETVYVISTADGREWKK